MESRSALARVMEFRRIAERAGNPVTTVWDSLFPESDGERWFVYALLDPITDDVRYIGSSVNPSNRFQSHYRGSHNRRVRAWFKELRSIGQRPRLVTLADVRGWRAANRLENVYIFEYSRNGAELLNIINSLETSIRDAWRRWAREWKRDLIRHARYPLRCGLPDSIELATSASEYTQSLRACELALDLIRRPRPRLTPFPR
ncbi:MAG: GIY-YIG nuclease family protein [Patescibacteria group bacterium]|nr:GIY-YIG nuclease family protein [Patescibacteria group bacterium]